MTRSDARQSGTWVIADRLPQNLWWRLISIVCGAALVSIGAQVTTPSGGDVPGTLQTFAVLLVGAILGPWMGTASVLLLSTLPANWPKCQDRVRL